jgi:sarcosine oxidase, subunit beta
MSIEAHDVVIIGGGIIGISMAYFLAKEGVDVCIVEKGDIAMASSGRCAGGIGQSHREVPDLPIARLAVKMWEKISAEMDMDIEYRQHNNLRLAMNEKHAEELLAMVERERKGGLNVSFVDRAEVKSRVPFVKEVYLGAVLSPTDGSAEPYLSCFALARAAKRAGAVIHQHRAVTGLQTTPQGKVQAVQTNQGPIAARHIVNAAGAWAESIGAMVGIKVPTTNKRSHLLVTERLPHFMDPFLSTDIYGYFRQTLSGNILIGYPAKPVTDPKMRVTYEAVSVGAQRADTIIPRLRQVSMIRSFTGYTVWTPDYLPLVGPVRNMEGFYIAAAFCGLGFAIGPGIGKVMADLITTGTPTFPLDAYRPERFEMTS